MDRVRTAAEDDADDARVVLGKLIVGQNLAEGVQLADTAADELRGLRSEIKNDNLLLHKRYVNVESSMLNVQC